jgi:putative PIN family toxin of toxin-antitoxin system
VIILLDTNVLIAAFVARGFCSELLEHCVRQHSLVTSDFIIAEFRDKLSNKFKYKSEKINRTTELLLSRMKVVVYTRLEQSVCRDPDDDNVLAAAIEGKCDCIITGDKDLLIIKQYGDIDILSPSEFREHERTK